MDEAQEGLARAQARVGQVLKEKWTLDKLLGVGGMGAVYAATHRNKKRGAVKVLHRELSVEPSIRERFLREGYAANSVGHPGAVEVFDDDIAEDGSAYLVMELLDGETVEARWERKGRKLPVSEVLGLADQLLETLAEAHDKGIVHRDLKPENLFLLRRQGMLKVLDFGIARLRESGCSATATQTGSAMGTPAFMAPEQARGRWEGVDGRTDLWAVGATLFTLVSGRYVHGTGTTNEILARAITQPAPSLGSVEPNLDAGLVAFVDKALAYEPSERFQNAREMQAELRIVYHSGASPGGMRPLAPSIPDGVGGASSSGSPSAGNAIPSGGTLTTGRAVVTATTTTEPVVAAPGRSLVPWIVAGGGALGLVLLGILVFGRDQAPASAPAPSPAAPAAAHTPAPPVVIATDAPSPPAAPEAAAAKPIDVKALPEQRRKPEPVRGAAPSGPPAKLLEAIAPASSAAARAPARPTNTVAPAAPPSSLFRKRQ